MRGLLTVLSLLLAVAPLRLCAQAELQYGIDTARVFSPGCDTLRTVPYFQVKGKYPESAQTLAAWADSVLQERVLPAGLKGYITFRVLIDCEGRLAAVKLLQTDEQYEPARFPPPIVNGLYDFVRSLKGWKPARLHGAPVNYFGYLSFKIEDSHVVRVSP